MTTASLDLDVEELDRKPEVEKKGRKASKEMRRQQLIEATIDSLAKRGYAETTMADVADPHETEVTDIGIEARS